MSASFLENWNKIVVSIRSNPSIVQAKAGPASQANASASVKAGAGSAGDVFVPKIAGVKTYRTAAEGAVVATLGRTDELIFAGEERDGYMKAETSAGTGWVKAIVMRKQ